MEKDDEVKGEGNQYTTEFRGYDSRLGKWLSVDPLTREMPQYSPYSAFDNNPVFYNDPLGLKTTQKLETFVIEKVEEGIQNVINDAWLEIENEQDLEKQGALIVEFFGKVEQAQMIQSEIEALRDSKVVYDLGTTWLEKDKGGKAHYDLGNETVSMGIRAFDSRYGDATSVSEMAHELKHFYQYESGTLSFSGENGRGGLLYDAVDEVEAFQRMHFFGDRLDVTSVASLPPGYENLVERVMINDLGPAHPATGTPINLSVYFQPPLDVNQVNEGLLNSLISNGEKVNANPTR